MGEAGRRGVGGAGEGATWRILPCVVIFLLLYMIANCMETAKWLQKECDTKHNLHFDISISVCLCMEHCGQGVSK